MRIGDYETDLKKCPCCGIIGLKRTDNSIDRIPNSEGDVEIYPINKCNTCNSYFEEGFVERGGVCFLGINVNKLSRREIKELNCDKWNFK